ncbi:MAG: hypothetical protein COA65_02570 [Rhodospirillaceae bacterium]|nr:MAG: hypothetical protein COA65_02570 [Rhodospirillaceae bacterium]
MLVRSGSVLGLILGFFVASGAVMGAEPISLGLPASLAVPQSSDKKGDVSQGTSEPATQAVVESLIEPAASEATVVPVVKPVAETRDPTAVDIAPLETVNPNSIGLLDADAGGFGVDMWQGTDGGLVAQLLPRLPAAPRSPTLRALQRRLLLSTATAPGNGVLQANLLPLRIDRLAAMGETKAVIELARIVPTHAMDESIALSRIESRFLSGDIELACKDVRSHIRDYQGAHWQRMQIFCEALAGEAEAARLGLLLLREMPGKSKPAFFQLIDAVLGRDDVQIFNLPDPTGFEFAMIKATKQQLPPDAGVTTHPAILRAIARYEKAPLALRLDAGERAEAMGTFAADELAGLYRLVHLRSEAFRDIDNTETDGVLGRALLVRAAKMRTDPEGQARLLHRLWKEAAAVDAAGTYGTVVRVTLPMLLEITPSLSLAWFADEAGRALLLGGHTQEASAWLALVQGEAFNEAAAARARDALWPFVKLADADGALAWDAARLDAWWKIAGPVAGNAKAARLFGLLAAMGNPVGGAGWARVLPDAPRTTMVVPSVAIWNALGEASTQGRMGETVLLVLLSMGEDGPGQVAPMTLDGVLAALRGVGLGVEARRLAVEAAMTQGF